MSTEEKKTHHVKAWVEAMGETVTEVIDLGITKEEWLALSQEARDKWIEDWAFNEVQMGHGYEEVE